VGVAGKEEHRPQEGEAGSAQEPPAPRGGADEQRDPVSREEDQGEGRAPAQDERGRRARRERERGEEGRHGTGELGVELVTVPAPLERRLAHDLELEDRGREEDEEGEVADPRLETGVAEAGEVGMERDEDVERLHHHDLGDPAPLAC
jgi:hypothetical protein